MEGGNIISDSDSKILRIEVEAAIKEVAFAVDYVELSRTLPCTDNLVYFNLRTKESEVFCVELTVQGFRVSHPNHSPRARLSHLDSSQLTVSIYTSKMLTQCWYTACDTKHFYILF